MMEPTPDFVGMSILQLVIFASVLCTAFVVALVSVMWCI